MASGDLLDVASDLLMNYLGACYWAQFSCLQERMVVTGNGAPHRSPSSLKASPLSLGVFFRSPCGPSLIPPRLYVEGPSAATSSRSVSRPDILTWGRKCVSQMRTWYRGVRFEDEEPGRLQPMKLALIEEDCSRWRSRMFLAQRTSCSSGLPCGNLGGHQQLH